MKLQVMAMISLVLHTSLQQSQKDDKDQQTVVSGLPKYKLASKTKSNGATTTILIIKQKKNTLD